MMEQTTREEDKETCSILRCIFCKAFLVAPVTLRCLHSLCKPCLMTLMEESSGADTDSFTLKCKACNYITRLEYISKTQDIKEKIVRSLSPPKVILTLLDFCEQNQEPVCTPCRNREKSTVSMYWCFDCVVYLCNECYLFHSSLPILGNHKTYRREEATEIATLLPSARDVCDRHGLRFKKVCKSSGNICCDTCISCGHIDVCSGEHKDLSGISSMVDQNICALKGSIKSLLDEIKNAVTNTSEVESTIGNSFQNNLSTLKKLGDATEKNLLERTDLLLAESYKMSYYKLEEIKSNSISLQQKKCILENARSIISVFQTSSGIRAFLEKKKVKSTTAEVQEFVDKFEEEGVQEVFIDFDTSLKNLFELAAFGTVRERQSVDLSRQEIYTDRKQNVADRISQWANETNFLQGKENLGRTEFWSEYSGESSESETVSEECICSSSTRMIQFGGRTYLLAISISIEKGHSHVTGCDWKSVDEIIIVDGASKGRPQARIYNTEDGQLKQIIALKYKPYDVVVLPDNKFVITFPKEEKLLIGSFEDLSAKRFVDVSIHCYGVCCTGKGETIIAGKETIVLCDSDFDETKTLTVDGEDVRYVCAYNNNLMFYTDMQNNEVSSVIGNGDNRFTYDDSDLKGPAGLILDKDKNVYVCEKGSEYLRVLNKGGTFLTKFEVGKNPTAISLSKDKMKICIIRGGRNSSNVADIYVSN